MMFAHLVLFGGLASLVGEVLSVDLSATVARPRPGLLKQKHILGQIDRLDFGKILAEGEDPLRWADMTSDVGDDASTVADEDAEEAVDDERELRPRAKRTLTFFGPAVDWPSRQDNEKDDEFRTRAVEAQQKVVPWSSKHRASGSSGWAPRDGWDHSGRSQAPRGGWHRAQSGSSRWLVSLCELVGPELVRWLDRGSSPSSTGILDRDAEIGGDERYREGPCKIVETAEAAPVCAPWFNHPHIERAEELLGWGASLPTDEWVELAKRQRFVNVVAVWVVFVRLYLDKEWRTVAHSVSEKSGAVVGNHNSVEDPRRTRGPGEDQSEHPLLTGGAAAGPFKEVAEIPFLRTFLDQYVFEEDEDGVPKDRPIKVSDVRLMAAHFQASDLPIVAAAIVPGGVKVEFETIRDLEWFQEIVFDVDLHLEGNAREELRDKGRAAPASKGPAKAVGGSTLAEEEPVTRYWRNYYQVPTSSMAGGGAPQQGGKGGSSAPSAAEVRNLPSFGTFGGGSTDFLTADVEIFLPRWPRCGPHGRRAGGTLAQLKSTASIRGLAGANFNAAPAFGFRDAVRRPFFWSRGDARSLGTAWNIREELRRQLLEAGTTRQFGGGRHAPSSRGMVAGGAATRTGGLIGLLFGPTKSRHQRDVVNLAGVVPAGRAGGPSLAAPGGHQPAPPQNGTAPGVPLRPTLSLDDVYMIDLDSVKKVEDDGELRFRVDFYTSHLEPIAAIFTGRFCGGANGSSGGETDSCSTGIMSVGAGGAALYVLWTLQLAPHAEDLRPLTPPRVYAEPTRFRSLARKGRGGPVIACESPVSQRPAQGMWRRTAPHDLRDDGKNEDIAVVATYECRVEVSDALYNGRRRASSMHSAGWAGGDGISEEGKTMEIFTANLMLVCSDHDEPL